MYRNKEKMLVSILLWSVVGVIGFTGVFIFLGVFFDTLGLALFTIAGIQKTLVCGHPFWVAISMGCITGSAGGVIRDLLLNRPPVIFRKEIYAMASILGGLVYWLMISLHANVAVTVVVVFGIIVTIRILAVKYHLSLPLLKDEEQKDATE